MPCDNIVFGNRFFTKKQAESLTLQEVAKQLRIQITQDELENAKFIWVREDNNCVWYYVDVDDPRITQKIDNKAIKNQPYIVMKRNPDWHSGVDTSVPKFLFTSEKVKIRTTYE